MNETLATHYTRLADNYDDFLYYSHDFVRSLTRKMVEMLRLRADDRLVDLGCGTGMYSLDILKQIPLRRPVIGVDPFAEMLERIPERGDFRPVCADALDFSAQPGRYDKVLMKEAVHHVDDKARLFRNLYDRLTPGGAVLLVHVPPRLDYPIFDAALRRSREWLADPDGLERLLDAAGFRVQRDALDYPHRLPKAVYFRMVANRYMSVLSTFSEAELEAGLAEMEARYRDVDTLAFNDHFDYLLGTRLAA